LTNTKLEISHHERLLNKYGPKGRSLATLNTIKDVADNSCQTIMQQLDDKANQTDLTSTSIVINKEIAISRIRSFNFRKLAEFLKTVEAVGQKISDEVNPHEEAVIMGAMPKVPEPIEKIIKQLIVKSSKGAQYLIGMTKDFCSELMKLNKMIIDDIYELD
jgi:hypothetical protein